MPKYLILPGHSFRDHDGSIKTGGQTIELGEDAAAANADKVGLLQEEPAAAVDAASPAAE